MYKGNMMDYINNLINYLSRTYPDLVVRIVPQLPPNFFSDDSIDEDVLDNILDIFFLSDKKRFSTTHFLGRNGFLLQDTEDFEEKLIEYVNTRLKELGYV